MRGSAVIELEMLGGNSMNQNRYQSVLEYIENYWPRIIRSNLTDRQTLIGLPRPYLVPSDGEMFQEMYYWDCYFMSLGLIGTAHENLVIDMTENMAHMFNRFGLIPNASRYYFLSRSQPPFFTAMMLLSYHLLQNRKDPGAQEFLARMTEVAEREYNQVWLGTKQPHSRLMYRGLSRYFDINFLDMLAACESGWDHSTRYDDKCLEHLPIDLNCVLASCENDIASAHAILGNAQACEEWLNKREKRIATIQKLMWDEESGFFFDYNFKDEKRNPHPSLAGFFPLWCGAATQKQAQRMVDSWLSRFEKAGGLVTTLEAKPGRQWAFPNGWAPLQWIVTAGLDKYGFSAEALRIRKKWCNLNASVFEKSGTLWEKYNVVEVGGIVEGGLYGDTTGFGWSNAVFVDFVHSLSEKSATAGAALQEN
jgi:alpha,alpha-trehalase